MKCQMCREHGKIWYGDNPKCAFENGEFSSNNWNCALMNALREIAKPEAVRLEDTYACAIPYEGDDNSGFIVLSWYKRRGNTGMAVLVYDDSTVVPITEKMARECIAYHKRNIRKVSRKRKEQK